MIDFCCDWTRKIRRLPALLFSVLCAVSANSVTFREPCPTLERFILFWKPKANLPDAEKSRIEFHLQQIAESVGFDRFTLPVLSRNDLFGLYESKRDPQQMIEFVGNHLNHGVSGVGFRVAPQQAQNCSGGG